MRENTAHRFIEIDVSKNPEPIKVSDNLHSVFDKAHKDKTPVLAIVTGTKPDFYKQAPLALEAVREDLPVFVIDTGQHFDEVLGFGIKEFNLQKFVGCNLQIRGDLMEKASELIIKFGFFGRYCKKHFDTESLLPLVHGDTLVAGIAPLAWVFGMGQKVGQNEAGLRSMSPEAIKLINPRHRPTPSEVQKFVTSQFDGKWFMAREEPFPEQIDTWICSAGTQFFFAPTELNRDNLIREGYPEDFIHVVGNSVVDAIDIKRKEKPHQSIFSFYPQLERDYWIRIDIHRRENLTQKRFMSIIGGLVELIENTDKKVVLVMLNATVAALKQYGLEFKLQKLADQYAGKFLMTPLWKEYAHVIEFLDSGRCWAEMTDSGSMQEELLYFPKVTSLTVRLNTDRPETIFNANSNLLVPPLNAGWIVSTVNEAYNSQEGLGLKLRHKKQIYGKPGHVSKSIIRIIKKEFENGDANFYPWLHQRLGLWKESQRINYM
ncbi:MAG: UDP-N-acetylglucosamine 2-epimerase [Thermoproteota archaeon]|nr:UDP-N-acetylglucosamine 2-epimerase [Thermoproteota archaeon]